MPECSVMLFLVSNIPEYESYILRVVTRKLLVSLPHCFNATYGFVRINYVADHT